MNEFDVLTDIFQCNIRNHPAMMAEPLSRENLPKLCFGYLAQPWPQFGQRAFLFISSSPDQRVVAAWYYTQNPEMENETFGYHKQTNIYFVGRRNAQFYADNNVKSTNSSSSSETITNSNMERKSKDAAVGSILEKHKFAIFHGPERVKDCKTSVLDVIIQPEDFEIYVVGAIMIEDNVLVNHHVNIRNERIREFMHDFATKIQIELKKKYMEEQRQKNETAPIQKEYLRLEEDNNVTNDRRSRKHKRDRSKSKSRSSSRSISPLQSKSRKHSSHSKRSTSPNHVISSASSSALSSSSSSSSSSLLTALTSLPETQVKRKKFWSCQNAWLPFMCSSDYSQKKLVIGQWDIHLLPLFAAWHVDKLPFDTFFPGCNTWVFYNTISLYGRENSIEGACMKWRDFSCEVRINFLISPRKKD